jgi:hypothetical protein
LSSNVNECKPLPMRSSSLCRAGSAGSSMGGFHHLSPMAISAQLSVPPRIRGLHSFQFPLNLSLLCPVSLNLS